MRPNVAPNDIEAVLDAVRQMRITVAPDRSVQWGMADRGPVEVLRRELVEYLEERRRPPLPNPRGVAGGN